MKLLRWNGMRVGRMWLLGSCLFGILVGIGLSWFGWQASTTTAVLLLVLAPLMLRKHWWALGIAVALGLALGLWRGGHVLSQLRAYEQYYYQEIHLTGTAVDDPAYAGEPAQLEFYVSDVMIGDASLPGKVRIRSFSGSVLRGDRVVVKGKFFSGFASWQGSISFANVQVVEHSRSWLEGFRRNFFAGMYSALPEPQASLGLGFLVGTRGLLPEVLSDQLRRTGLTHIVAVSGYNLTILVRLARRIGVRFSKRLGALLASGLVIGFLMVAGGSASIVRASVVVAFALSAWYYGRRVPPLILLLLSSAATALLYPLFFWFDLGWWLSFAAFFGVLILAPLLRQLIFKARKPHWLVEILLETFSAQLMTIPLTMSIFGEFSLVALLANIIILPFVPFAMLLGFIAGLAGMVAPAVAGWVGWPAQILLGYMVEVIRLLSRPKWALFGDITVPNGFMLGGYASLGVLSFGLYWWLRRTRRQAFTNSVIE